jgi:ABC-type antimicrobial peptide transport system permease subunit
VTASVIRAVRESDAAIPVMNVTTIDRIVDQSLSVRRFYTTITVAFALLALLLTVAGLGLIIARTISERRHELAIRAALGATAARLVGMVTIQGVSPVLVGGCVGIVAAFVAGGATSEFLYQVSPREPGIYVAVAMCIVSCGLLAALVPAMRMTRIPPVEALRSE